MPIGKIQFKFRSVFWILPTPRITIELGLQLVPTMPLSRWFLPSRQTDPAFDLYAAIVANQEFFLDFGPNNITFSGTCNTTLQQW